MLTTYEQRSKVKLTATILTILVIAGVVMVADHLKGAQPATAPLAQNTTSTATPSVPTTANTATNTTNYKDGTYTSTTDYSVPHGQEEIKVTLTLSGGTITDATIHNSENDFDSASYQEGFAAEYKNYVVGKKIYGLHLNVIAGASDTTVAFNDALSKITTQAQA